MINLITGTPGAGKTYLAVKLLTEKYFYWHKKDHSFYRQEKAKKYTIFTNIDDLSLPHKSLLEIFDEHKISFDQFFTVPFQEKLHKKYPHIIYVIDEAQQFIPSSYRNNDVIYYFDYHRHFGDSIWLISQDYQKISKNINVLVELEYRAVKSTFSILGEFRYNIKSNGHIFKRKTEKKDKRIFNLYKSFQGEDQEKHTNPLKFYIIGLLLAFLIIGYFFFDMIKPDPTKTESYQPHKKNESLSKNITTPFRNENPESISTEIDTDLDLNKIISVPIESFVSSASNQLLGFVCPVTHTDRYPHNAPYKIIKHQSHFYALLTLRTFQQLQSEYQILKQSIP